MNTTMNFTKLFTNLDWDNIGYVDIFLVKLLGKMNKWIFIHGWMDTFYYNVKHSYKPKAHKSL